MNNVMLGSSGKATVTREGAGRFSLSGVVTADNAASVRAEGDQLMASAGPEVILDLANIECAHTVLLSLLLCWQRLAVSRGQAIRFASVGERLHSLAALSGLLAHLPGFADWHPA